MVPQGLRELKDANTVPSSVRVRDEKSARLLDGFDLKSFRDSVKFSKPFTLSAMSGTASIVAAANVNFLLISIFLSFYKSPASAKATAR